MRRGQRLDDSGVFFDDRGSIRAHIEAAGLYDQNGVYFGRIDVQGSLFADEPASGMSTTGRQAIAPGIRASIDGAGGWDSFGFDSQLDSAVINPGHRSAAYAAFSFSRFQLTRAIFNRQLTPPPTPYLA